jgi:muconate cycloisomerase
MRRVLGRRMDIRLDANGAWSFDDALKTMRALGGLNVSFVEQPIAVAEAARLAELRDQAPIPVMLDESLISERDVQLAVEQKRCDAFNLRISKNGGLVPVLRYAKLAAENGIAVQLGCHPGETGLLSAAGRALACAVGGVRYLEGSYDHHQLRHNIIREDITFGRGGRARRLKEPGLGITIDDDALEQMTIEEVAVGRGGESER